MWAGFTINLMAPGRRTPTFLKQWRRFRNLTQEAAAARLDISQGQLSKIENGRHPYDQDFLEAAANAYSCTVADLLIRDPTRPDAVWSIHDNLLKATPAQKESVARVVDALLKTGSDG